MNEKCYADGKKKRKKGEEKMDKSLAIKIVLLCLICSLVSAMLVYAISIQTISSGVYSSAPSYTVWKENSNYFAKDSNGAIDYSGTNVNEIIQNIINTMSSSGGAIYLKSGVYFFSSYIDIKYSGISIIGESSCDPEIGIETTKTTIIQSEGHDAIRINYNGGSYDEYVTNVQIKNLLIDGIDKNGEAGIRSWGRYVTIEDVVVTSFHIGISLEWTDVVSVGDSWLNRVVCRNNTYEGIKIQSNDNQFSNIYCHYNQHGLLLKSSGGLLATNIHLWGNTNNGLKIVNSVNDHFVNLYTETNGDYGIIIGSLEGNVQKEKFVNIYSWGNGLGAASLDGSGSYAIENVTFLGGRFEGAVYLTDVDDLTIDYIEGYRTQNSGSTTFSSESSKVVKHGLAGTPTSVLITLGFNTDALYHVSAENSTTFTITMTATVNGTVYWYAEYKP